MASNNKGKRVMVTGATGYAAAHVMAELLRRGYEVVGTARTQQKADKLKAAYSQYGDKLKFVIVEDIGTPGAFEGKLDGLDGIFHVASPFHFKLSKSNKEELLDPAVNGVLEVLKSATKVPSIKKVIITSSFAAIVNFANGPSYVYSEADWNPITEEQALYADPMVAYVASKKLAEKAGHDFVTNNKPHFSLVSICPPMIYGPLAHPIDSFSELSESTKLFYEMIFGKIEIKAPDFDLVVDVRDLAKAHILAFENPNVANERFFITNGNYTWQEVVDYAHKNFPGQIKAKIGNPGSYPPAKFLDNNQKSVQKLGLTYLPKETTFHDAIAQFLEFEKQGK